MVAAVDTKSPRNCVIKVRNRINTFQYDVLLLRNSPWSVANVVCLGIKNKCQQAEKSRSAKPGIQSTSTSGRIITVFEMSVSIHTYYVVMTSEL